MTKYTYTEVKDFDDVVREDVILRVEDNAVIPKDPANSDYQRYLRHLAGEDESGTLS